MDSQTRQENRLAGETSPYLLQHKDNPVDWHPWAPEALDKARRENKPILLSVGYAACHWCHVMAHESFEDPETAAVMNRHFVNIKVDREERPDLDTIYQQALALLGEHGGWPLTMFLTPEGEPFWGGTYFPPESKYGRPGFKRVLAGIAAVYREEPDKVQQNVAALGDALGKLARPQPGEDVDPQVLDEAAARLAHEVDPQEGGVGGPPKFPQVSILKLFWRAWKRSGNEPFRKSVLLTLDRMCQGGIYDHLGGGFARYAVDRAWLVPHFEKMLYDNAQLVEILTWAWQDTRNPLYAERVRESVDWVLREMIAQDADGRSVGAFAASLDADSEGEEGKFYAWDEAEIDRVLGDDAALFKRHYDVRPGGNWEGKTILNRSQAPERADEATEAKLAELRGRLLEARSARVRPGWDDKVLADWNGLMIAALAEAAPVFEQPDWLRTAEDAFAFVAERMTEGGRLKHAWRRGRLAHPATLDDYAAMCRAAVSLHEMTGAARYLEQAEAWCEVVDRHHWDDADGGYFLTADDTGDVIVRTKAAHDSAMPSGNGMMLGVLARLFYLTGRDHYRQRAEALARAFAGELQRNFVALTTLLNNVDLLANALQVVVVGERGAPDTEALLAKVFDVSLPNRVLQVIGPDEALPEEHPAAGKGRQDGRATAYVCRGPSCSLPITAPQELATALAA